MTTPQELFNSIGEQMKSDHAVQISKMFGMPCLKIKKKAFACYFAEAMVFKLTSSEHAAALALSGAQLFDPSEQERPMKEWVQVPVAHAEQWPHLAVQAMEYVVTTASGK